MLVFQNQDQGFLSVQRVNNNKRKDPEAEVCRPHKTEVILALKAIQLTDMTVFI